MWEPTNEIKAGPADLLSSDKIVTHIGFPKDLWLNTIYHRTSNNTYATENIDIILHYIVRTCIAYKLILSWGYTIYSVTIIQNLKHKAIR